MSTEDPMDRALKNRPGDQPLPTPDTDAPAIQDLVISDMEARKKVGLERYGTLLKANNGRDMLQDLYEELLDGANYARGEIERRKELPALSREQIEKLIKDAFYEGWHQSRHYPNHPAPEVAMDWDRRDPTLAIKWRTPGKLRP